ncbi:MAG: hypothetical protein ACI4QA_07120 [Candidatus Spyradosoma sp.]
MPSVNPEEQPVLPPPAVADAAATRDAHFILGRLVRRPARRIGEKPDGNASEERPRARSRVFGAGFVVSAALHVALILLSVFVITKRIREVPEETPTAFITGAGGGNAGDPRTAAGRIPKKPKLDVKPPRIASKSANAAIALPPIEMKLPELSASRFGGDFSAGLGDGGAGGLGGGSGGGVGAGTGLGLGGGKNFVAKFAPKKVLGATMRAEKVAVYLDCSGSMLPFLPRVRREIYENYPDADIFEFDGAGTLVADGEIVGGRNGKGKSPKPRGGGRLDGTDRTKLSNDGRRIHKKFAEGFEQGSLGAWLDVMLEEKYDALAVFSDFFDGLRQYDERGRTLFADSVYRPTKNDARKARDLRWETRWHATLKRRRGSPRIYLFSIGADPQRFLAECVALSDGEISDVRDLRAEVVGEKPAGKGSRSRAKKHAESKDE